MAGSAPARANASHTVRVPLQPDFSNVNPEPVLQPFRKRLAELMLDGHVAGYLATQVNTMAEVRRGRLWWRHWTPPFEYLEVVVTAADGNSTLPEWEDPWWLVEDAADELNALQRDRFHWPDESSDGAEIEYHVSWLDSAKRDALWSTYGPECDHVEMRAWPNR